MKTDPRKLNEVTDRLKEAAAHPDVEPLLQAAHEAASAVREMAAAAGEPVRIRVVAVQKPGVRITVVGRRAGKYRSIMEHMLEQRVPAAADEIRADIRAKVQRR